MSLRKQNGKEYEPSSLRAIVQSIDLYLRKKNYAFDFTISKTLLKKKQKQLKSLGQGNRPNAADPLTDEDINNFYDRKVLGTDSPRALWNTVWLNNCIHFGMRLGKEQRDLRWGDLELKQKFGRNSFCRAMSRKTNQNTHALSVKSVSTKY